MAQALFDDHPIDLYLRESGEVPELMPGGLNEFSREPTHYPHDNVPYNLAILQTWFPRLFNTIQPVFGFIVTGLRRSSVPSEFAERFKYLVISSPLLSSSLSSSSINRAVTPTTPGHYDQSNPPLPSTMCTVTPTVSGTGSGISSLTLACLVPVALMMGYYLSCILLLAAMKILSDGGLDLPSSLSSSNEDEPWTLTLDCLEALVAANNTWDNVVSEALGILESEEPSPFQLSSPSSSFPSLRITLSSSLHTTERQCDNVRQLLAALTSPLVLSQLSHMYAPPSPSRVSHPKRSRSMSIAPPSPAHSRSTSQVRPLSLSHPPSDTYTLSRVRPVLRTSLADKRSTWNGSYMSLARDSSPRQIRRRPNLSTVFRLEDLNLPKIPPMSASSGSSHVLTLTPPLTPACMEDKAGGADAEDEPFGVAALDLHRRRRSVGVSLLNTLSPPSNVAHLPSPDVYSQFPVSYDPPLTSSFGSNFTSLSSVPSISRKVHPLSDSNLYLALQGALGSKRFACAHLLALRFSDFSSNAQNRFGADVGQDIDDEDESYWEDVRSVISLLTSTLEDASARLAEALADTVRRQEQESETITEEESCANSVSHERMESSNCSTSPLSFAPVPSHLARFTAHVDAITSALDDAREHLRQCVASLKEDAEDAEVTSRIPGHPESLQSYERLRRELGLALRECERGRGTLLEIVERSMPDHLAEEDDEEPPVPQEEQFSSGESDKTLYNSNEVRQSKYAYADQGQDHDTSYHDDDATSHLILTTSSQHLPPPGVEQVFESVSTAQPFVRERSKLTRQERIRMAKARRESQFGSLGSVPDGNEGEPHRTRENRGPGGEVVQELKDVIWQVSERRRKMIERS